MLRNPLSEQSVIYLYNLVSILDLTYLMKHLFDRLTTSIIGLTTEKYCVKKTKAQDPVQQDSQTFEVLWLRQLHLRLALHG